MRVGVIGHVSFPKGMKEEGIDFVRGSLNWGSKTKPFLSADDPNVRIKDFDRIINFDEKTSYRLFHGEVNRYTRYGMAFFGGVPVLQGITKAGTPKLPQDDLMLLTSANIDPLRDMEASEDIDVTVCDSTSDFAGLLKIFGGKIAAIDIEATSTDPFVEDFEVISLSICNETNNAYVIPYPLIQQASFKKFLEDFLESVQIVGYHMAYDIVALSKSYGIPLHKFLLKGDARVMRRVVDSEAYMSLGDSGTLVLMHDYERQSGFFDEALESKKNLTLKKAKEITFAKIRQITTDRKKSEQLYRYNGWDAVATWRLFCLENAYLDCTPEYKSFMETYVNKAYYMLMKVKMDGVIVDERQFQKVKKKTELKIVDYGEKLAQYNINFNSHKQLRELLFDKLKLPVNYKTDTGVASTKYNALIHLKDKHPIIEPILYNRQLNTYHTRYMEGFEQWIRDGVVYPTYNIDGTGTSRLSSSEPNMQNLPARKSPVFDPDEYKKMFVCRPGYKIVSADYSQIELRTAAGLSGDRKMKEVFLTGGDIHVTTAQAMLEKKEIGKEERSMAKPVNFGVIFGMQAPSLVEYAFTNYNVTITEEQARKFINSLLRTYKGLNRWREFQKEWVEEYGFVYMYWNRKPVRRRFVTSFQQAVNTPVQGSAAMFTIVSLSVFYSLIEAGLLKAQFMGTVHDSIMFYVPEQHLHDSVKKIVKVMSRWDCWGVPITVDVEVGDCWGKLKPYKEAS